MLDYEAECDVTDNKGYTPLFYAAKVEGIEALYYLLEHGKADPNIQCVNGKTPLFKASTYEDVMILMKYGADQSITMQPPPDSESEHWFADERLIAQHLNRLGRCSSMTDKKLKISIHLDQRGKKA